jgi:hypothetical protein
MKKSKNKKPPLAELRNIKILQINVSLKTGAYVNKQQQTEEGCKSKPFSTNFLENFKLVYSTKTRKIINK